MEYTGSGAMPVYEVNRDGDGFGGQNFLWFILLIFFFGGFGGGMGGFGGNSNAAQDAYLQNRFDTVGINNKLDSISNGICDATYALNNSIKDAGWATVGAVKDAAFANQMGLNDLAHQMAACCCETRTAIHAEGEATRALIQAQIIQELRDTKQSAEMALSNANQSQYILGQIGKFYPYQGINPCTLNCL